MAALHSHVEAAELLLDHGAKVDVLGLDTAPTDCEDGCFPTPLHLAVRFNRFPTPDDDWSESQASMVKLLLDCGANSVAPGCNGGNALDLLVEGWVESRRNGRNKLAAPGERKQYMQTAMLLTDAVIKSIEPTRRLIHAVRLITVRDRRVVAYLPLALCICGDQ